MNTISMDKKYKTRSGLPVRILCIDRKCNRQKVVGLVNYGGEDEVCETWTITGYFGNDENPHDLDLIEVKEKCVGWINVYKNYQGSGCWVPRGLVYDTQEEAIACQIKDYENTILCIRIEYEV